MCMQHLEDFLNYLKFEKRFSGHTQLAYKSDLSQLSQFMFESYQNGNPATFDHRMIRKWIIQLMDQGNSPRSVNRKLSTLKAFFKYLQKNEHVKVNPLDKITAPKVNKRLPVFIEEKHMDNLLDDVDFGEGLKGQRNKMIVETFYFTGIRLSELINLTEANIDFNNLTIKVLGKRNKERIIPINREFGERFKSYIKLKNKEASNVNFIFVSDNTGE